MNLRFRPTIRTWLIFIAIIGLGIGGRIESSNRRTRNHHARTEVAFISRAEKHERELAICRSHLSDPYDTQRNGKGFEGGNNFKSWAEEADWRARNAAAYRKAAVEQARLKEHYQRRLLLP